jgi:hypothetical protein
MRAGWAGANAGRGGCGAVGTRLDRQDLRLELDKGREVCPACHAIVLAGAVGEQVCPFLDAAVFEQAVPGVPVGMATQVTPVEIPVSVALDELRVPTCPRVHADTGAAVGVAAAEDCAALMTEDAEFAVDGRAAVGVPVVLDRQKVPHRELFIYSCEAPKGRAPHLH